MFYVFNIFFAKNGLCGDLPVFYMCLFCLPLFFSDNGILLQVGNYIHNMATFVGGLVIGLVNSWQIALLTLATGPFIVAAGGISNIFLHRLAENIQDAYAEAASIAEQVTHVFALIAFA